MGQLPTHPELLDWLACELRDHAHAGGGSLKALHRMIVTSAAYRQVSTSNADGAIKDAGNALLWRMNRRQFDAESIRDSVLAASGHLRDQMYGPSFQTFVIEKPEHSPHYEYEKADPDDPRTFRRTVYRFLVRSQPDPLMQTLDCADPSQIVEKRDESITALQALALLNDRFLVRMAEHAAQRIRAASTPHNVLRAASTPHNELRAARTPLRELRTAIKRLKARSPPRSGSRSIGGRRSTSCKSCPNTRKPSAS